MTWLPSSLFINGLEIQKYKIQKHIYLHDLVPKHQLPRYKRIKNTKIQIHKHIYLHDLVAKQPSSLVKKGLKIQKYKITFISMTWLPTSWGYFFINGLEIHHNLSKMHHNTSWPVCCNLCINGLEINQALIVLPLKREKGWIQMFS